MSQDRLCEAVEIASGPTVALRFLLQHGPYQPGQVYRIKTAAAERLVELRIADLEWVEEEPAEPEPKPRRKQAR